ncbi:hypothetical protein BJF78_28790 [Pseudonocardia sp. CNS-139]|nr:hypothetical protein BJF78_28790 [Pseudonocardia sp. CNS-139]
MATKTVVGVDGRTWSVRRNIEWSVPATGDDFEHDVDGGRGAVVLVLSALFVFWLIIIVWAPAAVHVPWFLWVLGALVVLFFPTRWFLRRPWTITAKTDGGYDQPKEMWSGMVRGGGKAKEEMRILTRRIRTQGTPGHTDSPLQPVT